MFILRAFKTELDLNHVQKTACARHAGAARFAYNWGLARKIEAYQAGKKTLSAIDLHRELNALKKTDLPWMYAVSKCAPQEALRNLDQAFAHFFRRVKEKKAGKKVNVGFPKFKSKKNGRGSFRLTGAIHVFEKAIQLPRLGVLRLKESGYLPMEGVHILSATVSEKAGRWFVALQVEMEIPDPVLSGKAVEGVDLGIKNRAQVSDGMCFKNPRALKRNEKKIKRLQKTVSRRQPGSANRKKAVGKLATAYAHVANIRKNDLHQVTSRLTTLAPAASAGGTKSVVVLEDLNVSGMLKNHHLAQAIADVGMGEFRRQMEYKGAWYGCQVRIADWNYPSTKRCSHCGHRKKRISLGTRIYRCPVCGLRIDRDLNAALNLQQWFFSTASSAGIHACGEDIRPGFQAAFVEAGTEHQSTKV
jgi:putative transposase